MINISTFQNQACETPHFYILSIGNNSGRPGEKPNRNSFLFSCGSEEEKQQYFQSVNMLFEMGYFKRFLKGSCQQFITLGDFKQIVFSLPKKGLESKTFNNTARAVQKIEEHLINLEQQISLLKEYKIALFQKEFKSWKQ